MSKDKEGWIPILVYFVYVSMLTPAPAKILKYLTDQNRPYSAGLFLKSPCLYFTALFLQVDILNNLHKEFGKTVSEILLLLGTHIM